jgi:hypothetical protein
MSSQKTATLLSRFLALTKLSEEMKNNIYIFNAFMYKKMMPAMDKLGTCRNTDELFKPVVRCVKDDLFTKLCVIIPIIDR